MISQTRVMSRLKRKPSNTMIAMKNPVSPGYFTGQDGRSRNGRVKAENHQQTSACRRAVFCMAGICGRQCVDSMLHAGRSAGEANKATNACVSRDTRCSGTGLPGEEIKARAGNGSAELKELASQQNGR
jgi:hypothetical protein